MTADALATRADDAPASGDAFRRLLRGLVLSERFHFYIAVCDTPRVADRLLDELASALPAERGAEVRFVRLDPYAKHDDFDEPLSVDEMLTSTLEPLATPPEGQRGHGVVHVLDASRASTDDEKAWRWLFGRMNELRNHITRALGGELLLLATPAIEQLFVEAAPDFWSIRSETYVFREGVFQTNGSQVAAEALGPEIRFASRALESVPLPPPPAPSPEAVRERFKPFLDFVREHWPVQVPKGLFEPSRLPNTLAIINSLLWRGGLRWPSWSLRVDDVKQELNPRSSLPEELAEGARQAGRTDVAESIYRTLIDDKGHVDQGVSTTFARVLLSLVALKIEQADLEEARALVNRAKVPGFVPTRTRQATWALWLESLALFHRCEGDSQEAVDMFEASIVSLRALPPLGSMQSTMRPEGLVLAAESALALGKPEHARRWGEEALSLVRSLPELQFLWPPPSSAQGRLLLRALLVHAEAYDETTQPCAVHSQVLEYATQIVDRWPERSGLDAKARELAVRVYEARAQALERAGNQSRAAHYRQKAHALAQGGEPGHSSSVA